jgi:enoyl-CoA hydratase/carnithine racemase
MNDTRFEAHGTWVEIAIDRPGTSNAIREQTASELLGHIEQAEANKACRAILIRGEGKHFCSGVDTSEQRLADDERFELWRRRKRSRQVNRLFRALPEVTKPVIAVVEGVALGGGFELALLCDMVVAGAGATFGLPECGLGLMPGGGGTQTLPRLIGKPLAKELLWTGRKLDAQEALSLRIVNHVTDTGCALDKARELATGFDRSAPLSIMFSKQAVERGYDAPMSEAMNIEADGFFALAFSEDRQEGLSAFRDRRVARFRGM